MTKKQGALFIKIKCVFFAILLLFIFNSCQTSVFSQKNSPERIKIETLLNNDLTESDLNVIETNNTILKMFQSIALEKYSAAIQMAKKIMYTPGGTPEEYKFALSAHVISTLLLTEQNQSEKNELTIEQIDFNTFQYNQCQELCDSIGWKMLAEHESDIFSLNGYNNFLISKKILFSVHKFLPLWIEEKLMIQSAESNAQNDEDSNSQKIHFKSDDSSTKFKKALDLFLEGKFDESISFILTISTHSTDSNLLSKCYYWLGRNYLAIKNAANAKKFFLLSGNINPLNLYDSLSGQMLHRQSGKASTTLLSPFTRNWHVEYDKWIENYKTYKDYSFDLKKELIEKTIHNTILLSSQIRVENKIESFEKYRLFMKENETSFPVLFLREEINWLKENWTPLAEQWENKEEANNISTSVAWLIYSLNNYLEVALFVNETKNSFNLSSEKNNFLYFVFYPKPEKLKLEKAISICPIDPDLFYAINRQETFFTSKNPQNNVLKKVCLIEHLLKKYNSNLAHTLAAYRSDEKSMNSWLNAILPQSKDDVIFLEFIPNEDVKKFTQEALRNYYNMKWIYSQKKNEKKWLPLAFSKTN